MALRLSITGSGVNVGVSVGGDVGESVSEGIGVDVSGMKVAGAVSVMVTPVGDTSITGEGEAGVPPVRLHAMVVRTNNPKRSLCLLVIFY